MTDPAPRARIRWWCSKRDLRKYRRELEAWSQRQAEACVAEFDALREHLMNR